MKFKLNIKGKEYEVEILETEGKVKIKVGNKEFVFSKKREEKERVLIAKTFFPKRNFSEKKIFAPIAGIISKIFVKEGDFLKKGQKILLLSAMKMENEIVSEFEGRVEKILVKEEEKVKGGQTLLVLK